MAEDSGGRWNDHDVETALGLLLRIGVLLATAVAVVGGVLYLYRHGLDPVHYATFRGEPPDLLGITGVLKGVLAGRGRSVIQLGLLILIATPVCRVALSLVGFYREGDRTYVAITFVVLAILLASLFGRF